MVDSEESTPGICEFQANAGGSQKVDLKRKTVLSMGAISERYWKRKSRILSRPPEHQDGIGTAEGE